MSEPAAPLRSLAAGKRKEVNRRATTSGYTAGALNGAPSDGFGGHWWYQLTAIDLFAAQLPATVGHLHKPASW
jgi:hypothetical protein